MGRHGEEGYQMLKDRGIDEDISQALYRGTMTSSSGRPKILLTWPSRQLITSRGWSIASAAVKGGSITEVTEKTLQKKFKE